MGFLKHLLTGTGAFFTAVGFGLMVDPAATVKLAYQADIKDSALAAWSTRGAFEFGFGLLMVFSRSWGSDERFKVGLVSVAVMAGLCVSFFKHAEASGMPAFALTVPAYGGAVLATVLLAAAVVINKMEPGIFESDKDAPRRSARTRAKRT
mmetsp:Transcript_4381/g.10657  ORF Transcript_4381/g.10657 Transcript_4381/m.10657 type:complete len:151 (-) Transcript_4381:406-858(-)